MFADLSGLHGSLRGAGPRAGPGHRQSLLQRSSCPSSSATAGTVDKFIGVEIMALFGAPLAHENDAECALRAALVMRDALADLNAADGTRLGMAIAVEQWHGRDRRPRLRRAGAVLRDRRHRPSAGAPRRGRPRVRISSSAPAGRLSALVFDFSGLPPMTIKGKAEPVAVARLEDSLADAQRMRGVAGLVSPLVGPRPGARAAHSSAVRRPRLRLRRRTRGHRRPRPGHEPPGGRSPAAHRGRRAMARRAAPSPTRTA